VSLLIIYSNTSFLCRFPLIEQFVALTIKFHSFQSPPLHFHRVVHSKMIPMSIYLLKSDLVLSRYRIYKICYELLTKSLITTLIKLITILTTKLLLHYTTVHSCTSITYLLHHSRAFSSSFLPLYNTKFKSIKSNEFLSAQASQRSP